MRHVTGSPHFHTLVSLQDATFMSQTAAGQSEFVVEPALKFNPTLRYRSSKKKKDRTVICSCDGTVNFSYVCLLQFVYKCAPYGIFPERNNVKAPQKLLPRAPLDKTINKNGILRVIECKEA